MASIRGARGRLRDGKPASSLPRIRFEQEMLEEHVVFWQKKAIIAVDFGSSQMQTEYIYRPDPSTAALQFYKLRLVYYLF